jgi:LysM repeat protein
MLLILTYNKLKANPLDSIKVENVKGKKFIIHKVDKGQGLYAIARRYNIDVQKIIDENTDKIDKLNQGDLIKIPTLINDTISIAEVKKEKNTNRKNKIEQAIIDSSTKKSETLKIEEAHANADSKDKEIEKPKIHIVSNGETVFKVAQKYKITPQLLIKWNGIKNNKLEVGQELIINGDLVIKPFEKWNTPNSVAPKNIPPQNILYSSDVIEETGFAGISIEKSILHKTVPIGTIILLTDADTGKECYIKVTGKLEQQYKNVILLIDEVTKQKLNASSSLIRVNIKYVLQ